MSACGARVPTVQASEAVSDKTIGGRVGAHKDTIPFFGIKAISDISRCLTVAVGPVSSVENLAIAEVTLTLKESLASCGCMSRGLLYRSVEMYQDFEMELASAALTGPRVVGRSEDRRVVVTARLSNPPEGAVKIHVGCLPPQ